MCRADDRMSEPRFDLVVIGSGPGGYVAAIRPPTRHAASRASSAIRPGRHLPERRLIPSQGRCRFERALRRARDGFAAHGDQGQVELD